MAQEEQIIGKVLQETYRIERLIGEGGMGAVYEASHLRLRRRFAIKLLFPQVAQSSEAVARFRREGEVTSELGHPNIIEIIDLNFTPEGAAYIVMELLTGESLSSRIQGGRLTLDEVSSILKQTASALEAAHRHGIIHRDLKPQNIFIAQREDGSEVVKVLDFGISKVLGSSSMMTGTSALLGTPNYMAPEQAEGHAAEADVRTDVFALGAILYEMLAGRPAFVGASVPSILYQVVHQEPRPLRELRPDLSVDGERVVTRAMSKKPAARYDSIATLAQEFTAAIGTTVGAAAVQAEASAPQAPQTGPVPAAPLLPRTTLSGSVGELRQEVSPRRTPVFIMGLVVAMAVLVGSGVYLGTRPDQQDQPAVALGTGAPVVSADDIGAKQDIPLQATPKSRTSLAVDAAKGGQVAKKKWNKKKKTVTSKAGSAAPDKKRGADIPGDALHKQRARRPVSRKDSRAVQRHKEQRGKRALPRFKDRALGERPRGHSERLPRKHSRLGGYGRMRIIALVGKDSYPARVYVDGRKRGTTPLTLDRIAAGEHTVRVEKAGYHPATKSVLVRPRKTTMAILKLTPLSP